MAVTDEFRCALHTLHVESNHIDYLWALRLDYKFAETFYLRCLNLANNSLEEKGTRFLCDYLSENSQIGLEELNLSGNNVNREALRQIREYLRIDKSMKKLVIKDNLEDFEQNVDLMERRKKANELIKIEYL